MKNQKTVELRIPEELLAKLAHVSNAEGRSLNNHFLLIARNSVAYFEKNHGKISPKACESALESLKSEAETRPQGQ